MIKFSFLFLLILSLLPHTLFASQNPFSQEGDFQEGFVAYRLSGSEIGTQTLYIKEYGKVRALYTYRQRSWMHKVAPRGTLRLQTPQWDYEVDLLTLRGTKLPSWEALLNEAFEKLSPSLQEMLLVRLQNLQDEARECGGEEIFGLSSCVKKEGATTTLVSEIGNIPLKSQTDIFGFHQKIEVTALEKTEVAEAYFTLPKGVVFFPSPMQEAKLRQEAEQFIKKLLE